MAIVSAAHLGKDFDGVCALSDVSFEVGEGEIFALVGPNGAGKTTLMRMLTDILRPDTGSLSLFGQSVLQRVLHMVGYMPEERGLYKGLTPLQTVTYFARLKGMDKRSAGAAAERALNAVGMLGHARRKMEELSKGMAQRVQFAATVAHRPKLLILDEPFTGLDPVSARHMQKTIQDTRAAGGTILLSTHNMDHAEKLCDRILMLYRGKVHLYGAIGEIKDRFTGNSLRVEHDGPLPAISSATPEPIDARTSCLRPQNGAGRREVLDDLVHAGADIVRFEPVVPSLEDIFVEVVGAEGGEALRATREAVLSRDEQPLSSRRG